MWVDLVEVALAIFHLNVESGFNIPTSCLPPLYLFWKCFLKMHYARFALALLSLNVCKAKSSENKFIIEHNAFRLSYYIPWSFCLIRNSNQNTQSIAILFHGVTWHIKIYLWLFENALWQLWLFEYALWQSPLLTPKKTLKSRGSHGLVFWKKKLMIHPEDIQLMSQVVANNTKQLESWLLVWRDSQGQPSTWPNFI